VGKRVLAAEEGSCCSGTVRWLVIPAFLGLISCSASRNSLEVRQYHLRSLELERDMNAPRAEQLNRFHGAVTDEERRNRLGHYYTVEWQGPEDHEGKPVRLVFRYRQAKAGSEIRQLVRSFPPGMKGKSELRITGPAYLNSGRVLAWHLSYYRGEHLVETRQSYLWE
jgi:hypothetical protein